MESFIVNGQKRRYYEPVTTSKIRPRRRPAVPVGVRIWPSVYARLTALKKAENRNMSDVINSVLDEGLKHLGLPGDDH